MFFLFLLLPIVHGHVSLTFPEARFPPLDFLDTSRTMGPCGVPKPRMPHYTNLLVGNTYNFTWRLQYPHQGGFRLLLLDSNGDEVERLAPMNGIEYTGTDDQTTQSERVRFTRPCDGCTVVLERQALEWGKNYRFRSCADVSIVAQANDETTCSGRGMLESNKCSCDNGYTGDICQYLAHCERDADCMNSGKCVSEPGSLVAKTCYCSYGYFGKVCEQSFNREGDNCFAYSERDETKYDSYGMFNANCYNREKLNEQDAVYYRQVKNEVEVIMDFATSSWVSLGWRPEGLDPSCRLFPDLEGARSKRSTVEMPPMVAAKDQVPASTSIRQDQPPIRVAQEGPRPAMPRNNGLLTTALEAPLHAMDCIDVIVASVKDGRTRINDMYSRDRSTPLEDSWYDGEMSLSASAGVEMDGRTVVMFRRMVQEIEPTDHPLGPGRMFVSWAKGQTQGAYTHVAMSALDANRHDGTFYADDVLKYHGSKNRGVHPIDFTTPVKLPKPGDAAFGVNIAQGNKVLVDPARKQPEEKKVEEPKEAKSTTPPKPPSDSTPRLTTILSISFTITYLLF